MSNMLDGYTFDGGTLDVLWASEVKDDLDAFIHATNKSTFVSLHEHRWPGISSLYCRCFVRAVESLDYQALRLATRW